MNPKQVTRYMELFHPLLRTFENSSFQLFLTEAALLGLAGGLIGATAGLLLSIGLGKAVFGVAARPRLIVYPVAVGLTMLVAILSAFPLRRLASIRPASVFRGEA